MTKPDSRRFAKGAFGGSGVFTCRCCNKRTRYVGDVDAASIELCVPCYEYCGWENSHNDGCHDDMPADDPQRQVCPICNGVPAPWETK